MSVAASSWVWEHSRAKGTARLVLLALADHAGADGGDAYPSVRRLSVRCGISTRSVQGALKVLVALGELEVEDQAGPRGVNRYRLSMTPAESAPPQELRPADPAPTPRRIASVPPQNLHPTPADPAPEPTTNRPDPSLNRRAIAAAFDEWWKHYPLKKAKGAARPAFEKALKKVTLEVLIAGADSYATDPARDPDFTKHPKTWLNGECWEDQPEQERRRSKAVNAAERFAERHSPRLPELTG